MVREIAESEPSLASRSPESERRPAQVMEELVRGYWRDYPPHFREALVLRNCFQLELLRRCVAAGSTVCDVGGGWGNFACLTAAMGFQSILLDDFGDAPLQQRGDPRIRMPEAYGVRVIQRDVIGQRVDLPPESIDAFTSFGVLEHLHASPKRMLHELRSALRPGGWLIIGVPNRVNLRKRLVVPFGGGKWSAMQDWYEEPAFRGHVREPDLGDLRYISQDLALENVRFCGANFMGYETPSRTVRRLVRWLDRPLRLRPALCSDLYLMGQKPE